MLIRLKIGFAVALLLPLMASAAELLVGFGRTDVTPELGVPIGGYDDFRYAKRVLDPLEAVAVAFSDGTRTAVVCAVDNLHLGDGVVADVKRAFAQATRLPEDALFLHSTHTHTSAETDLSLFGHGDCSNQLNAVRHYLDKLVPATVDACTAAIGDLSPAKLSMSRTKVERVSFCRRYLMKDGTVHTNPGVGNRDIVKAVREADEQVQLLRADRVGRPSVAVVNFQTHPDVIGGDNISGDWPALCRRQVESCFGGEVRCLFVNGAQGDVNHVCVDPRPGEANGMHTDPDAPRGYDRAVCIGRKLAGAVLGAWGECVPLEPGEVRFARRNLKVPAHKASAAELKEAKRLVALAESGQRDQIPYEAMEYTTVMAGAHRAIRLENAPDFFEVPISAVAIGRSVAFCGFPGEPFNAIGEAIKEKSPFALTMPACLTNGSQSYFPSEEAFAGGGYEAASSRFGPLVEKALIDGHLELVQSL